MPDKSDKLDEEIKKFFEELGAVSCGVIHLNKDFDADELKAALDKLDEESDEDEDEDDASITFGDAYTECMAMLGNTNKLVRYAIKSYTDGNIEDMKNILYSINTDAFAAIAKMAMQFEVISALV